MSARAADLPVPDPSSASRCGIGLGFTWEARERVGKTRDKKWVKPELRIHHALALWAADCAEHVLPLFEAKYPEDDRPRKAIEAGRAWVRGELKMTEGRPAAVAAHAAARDADDPAARAAARSAGHAFGTAHMADHAQHAANYAAAAVAKAAAPYDAEAAKAGERDWQWERLTDDLRSLGFPKGR